MAKAEGTRAFKPEAAARILAFLRDGSPPFLRVASRRARCKETAVDWWWRAGREEWADPEDPQTIWALEVSGVQGDYIAKWSAWLLTADKAENEKARQVDWILTRLDRELFDLSRPPKEAKPGETNKPAHTVERKEKLAEILGKEDLQ